MITKTIKEVFTSAFSEVPTVEDMLANIEREEKANLLEAISYVGEGNIHLQHGSLLFQEDIDKVKEEVLNFTFPETPETINSHIQN